MQSGKRGRDINTCKSLLSLTTLTPLSHFHSLVHSNIKGRKIMASISRVWGDRLAAVAISSLSDQSFASLLHQQEPTITFNESDPVDHQRMSEDPKPSKISLEAI